MKPLKFSALISETAKRSGQQVHVTDALLRIYFKELRTALTSLSYPRVQVLNLGTFNLKPQTVEKKLSKKQAFLQKLSDESPRAYSIRQEVEQDIGQMMGALKIMNGEKARKISIKNARNSKLEHGNQSNRTLEKKG